MIINYLFTDPLFFIIWVLGIVFAITVHEFCHAWSAQLLGDKTAKYLGRVTLNPLAHLDLYGFIFLLVAGFGWGKPVPVNPYNLKRGKWGQIIVSLAGVGVNLATALVAGLAIKLLLLYTSIGADNLLIAFLVILVQLSVVLLVFNLLPIPPLDGSKVLTAVLPPRFNSFKLKLERYGPMVLLGLIFIDYISNAGIFAWLFNKVLDLVLSVIS